MKRGSLLIFFSLLVLVALAQDTRPWRDRLYFGGNFGFGVGGNSLEKTTFLDISPVVGYKFNDRFIAGPGIIYQYLHYQNNVYKISVDFNNYGAKLFSRYFFTESLFAHAEPEWLNREYVKNYDSNGKPQLSRVDVFSFFIGGGYRARFGAKSGFDLLILYNLNDNIYSPYSNPLIRAGVGFGI